MEDQKQAIKHAPPLNKFMHPRNPYKVPPSFKQLFFEYKSTFGQYCVMDTTKNKVRVDFSKAEAVRALAVALLHKDFGLTVEIPSNNLVPTIPLRLNYLLWLEDLVGLWCPKIKKEGGFLKKAQTVEKPDYKPNNRKCERPEYVNPVIGMDVGCGSSCVYGLLGARHCGWHMLATDIDQESLKVADKNVKCNNMNDKVCVLEGRPDAFFSPIDSVAAREFLTRVRSNNTDESNLMEQDSMETDQDTEPVDAKGFMVDFTMCNPPFFSSEQECDSDSKTKKCRTGPNNGFTGTKMETIYPEGGEVAFITRMVEESSRYRHKVRVFSSLVGTAKDLKVVWQVVRAANPRHCVKTEFCQGRTMRWGVAWTWSEGLVLPSVVSTKQAKTAKPIVLHLAMNNPGGVHATVNKVWLNVVEALKQIKLKPKDVKRSGAFAVGNFAAYQATWANQRKQRRANKQKQNGGENKNGGVEISMDDQSEERVSNGKQNGTPTLCSDGQKRKERIDENLGDEHMECQNLSPPNKRIKLKDEDSDEESFHDTSTEESPTKLDSANVSDISDTIEDRETIDENEADETKTVEDEEKTKLTGKPALLRFKVGVASSEGTVRVTLEVFGGTLGRDGAQQVLTYLKNKLSPIFKISKQATAPPVNFLKASSTET